MDGRVAGGECWFLSDGARLGVYGGVGAGVGTPSEHRVRSTLGPALPSLGRPSQSPTIADCECVGWSLLQDEDTATPLASSYGSSTVALYTGSATQQLLLYRFDTDIDPSKTTSLKVKVPATIGPNSSN